MDDKKQEKQKMRTSTKWAIGFTFVWLAGVAIYVGVKGCKFFTMDPNEVGDFLAGAFSPLALFWLVAGYMQQGEALRLNTDEIKLQREALLLQHQELAEQVKATLKVAVHAEQQADASASMAEIARQEREDREREEMLKLQPSFKIYVEDSGSAGCLVTIQNDGREAFNVSVRCSIFEHVEEDKFEFYRNGHTTRTLFKNSSPKEVKENFDLTIHYTDVAGTGRFSVFTVKENYIYCSAVACIDQPLSLAEPN